MGKATLFRKKLYATKNKSLWIKCKQNVLYSTLRSSSPQVSRTSKHKSEI